MRKYALNPIKPGDGDPRHGTMTGYDFHRCKCDLCMEVQRRTKKERNARKKRPHKVRGKSHDYDIFFRPTCRCGHCPGMHAIPRHKGDMEPCDEPGCLCSNLDTPDPLEVRRLREVNRPYTDGTKARRLG
jgi:hypothetical protein